MELLVIIIFGLGYLAITLEHQIKIDKLVPALLMMALAWAVITLGHLPVFHIGEHGLESAGLEETLLHHFGKTGEILFFLIGAMTIVEIIETFHGFETIKRFIKTNSKKKLLWIIAILAFFLSAIIDNLTATIVLIVILRKLIEDKEDRMWFVGMIIITANAGGAWSPIGDVTTTMLWMAGKVTVMELVKSLLLPSLVAMALPTFIASRMKAFQGKFNSPENKDGELNDYEKKLSSHGAKMLYIGMALIVFVPIFKTITHLPPYIGMMLSLSIFTIFAEILSKRAFSYADMASKTHHNPVHKALSKVEMPSILFFLGILMGVAALESLGTIFHLGNSVTAGIGTNPFIAILGFMSAILDNVPLVAAALGMFPNLVVDSAEWHFIAFAAGTGGAMLIIGSAAGVVAMGMEKISFFWYLKKISWLALIGYLAGLGVIYLTIL